jgi:predicted glutamine amidotransferase
METGLLAAEALLAGRPPPNEAVTRAGYETALAALQAALRPLRAASRSTCHPWLADLVIWRANRSPRILRRMAGVLEETSNPGNLVQLARPGLLFESRSADRAQRMCQLLGMNANTPTDVMFSFAGLAHRADEHKDGFGIAFFEDRGLRHFIDHHGARNRPVAELVKRYPIRSGNVIAHIRKATQGRVALENTHPFVRELWGRYWVFAHNGDLKGFQPRLHGAFRPVGDTDSERAFCWLMQELAKAHASVPSIDELTLHAARTAAAAGRARHLQHAAEQRPGAVGALQHPAALAGARHPFGAATLADEDLSVDFGALTSPNDRVAVVATEPCCRC